MSHYESPYLEHELDNGEIYGNGDGSALRSQYVQRPRLKLQNSQMRDDELQKQINLARQETKQLYSQIEKIKGKIKDAALPEMTKNVPPLARDRINVKPTLTLKGHNNKISDVRWSRDSRRVLSASQDGFMLLWDACSGFKENAVPLDSQWVLSCDISPSGTLVASAGLSNNCTVYRVSQENRVQQSVMSIFKGHTGYVSDLAFTDNSHILTASGDMTCAYWDISKSKRIREYAEHLGDVLALSPSPSSSESGTNTFASCGSDGYVYLWDVRTGSVAQTFFVSDSDINAIQFFKDGNAVASGSDDGVIRLFDLRSDCQIGSYSLADSLDSKKRHYQPTYAGSDIEGHSGQSRVNSDASAGYLDNQGLVSIDFSGSGRLIYSCYTDFGCVVWDILKSEIVGKLEGHSNRVSRVKSSPDGLAVCTGSWDSTMKIWSPSYS